MSGSLPEPSVSTGPSGASVPFCVFGVGWLRQGGKRGGDKGCHGQLSSHLKEEKLEGGQSWEGDNHRRHRRWMGTVL